MTAKQMIRQRLARIEQAEKACDITWREYRRACRRFARCYGKQAERWTLPQISRVSPSWANTLQDLSRQHSRAQAMLVAAVSSSQGRGQHA